MIIFLDDSHGSENARRFFFTAPAAWLMLPCQAGRIVSRKSSSKRRMTRDFGKTDSLGHAIAGPGQIRKLDRVPIAQPGDTRKYVLEFAHIVRPRVAE